VKDVKAAAKRRTTLAAGTLVMAMWSDLLRDILIEIVTPGVAHRLVNFRLLQEIAS
jgi:hypothetical protein